MYVKASTMPSGHLSELVFSACNVEGFLRLNPSKALPMTFIRNSNKSTANKDAMQRIQFNTNRNSNGHCWASLARIFVDCSFGFGKFPSAAIMSSLIT
jgi:hypothetical protein